MATTTSTRRGIDEIMAATDNPRYIFRNNWGYEIRPAKTVKGGVKSFSSTKLGEEGALKAAIAYRDELIIELERTPKASDGKTYVFGATMPEGVTLGEAAPPTNGVPPKDEPTDAELTAAATKALKGKRAAVRKATKGQVKKTKEQKETERRRKNYKREDETFELDGDPIDLKEPVVIPTPPPSEVIEEPDVVNNRPLSQTLMLPPTQPFEPAFAIDRSERVMAVIDGSYMRYSADMKIDYVLFKKHYEGMWQSRIAWNFFDTRFAPGAGPNSFYRFLMSAPPYGPKFKLHLYDPEQTETYCTKCGARIEGRRQKGVDVAMAVHALAEAHQNTFDRLLLCSGDRDLLPAVEVLIMMGKKITLIGFADSVSAELQMVVDEIFWLDEFLDIYKNPLAP